MKLVAQLPQLKAGRKKINCILKICSTFLKEILSHCSPRPEEEEEKEGRLRDAAAFGVALGEEVKLKRIVRIGIELHRFSWELHIEKKFRCWMPQAICVPFESFDSEDFPF